VTIIKLKIKQLFDLKLEFGKDEKKKKKKNFFLLYFSLKKEKKKIYGSKIYFLK